MICRFLRPDAAELIGALDLDPAVRGAALDVVEKGYTVIPSAISAEDCRAVIDAFRGLEQNNEAIFGKSRNPAGHYPRIVNLHYALSDLSRLFTRNPLLLGTLDALFGAPASLYTSLFYEVGSQQAMHRDTPVFSTRPEYLYFGVTVYLEPADEDNGCLEVLEGGHLLPEVDREAMALRRYGSLDKVPNLDNDIWVEYQKAVIDGARAAGIVPRKVPVKAGDTLIWHPQLPHGGSKIRDMTRTRFSLVMHVTPEGVPVYHQNVFFAPSKEFPETAKWGYHDIDGRKIADHGGGVSFGHQYNYTRGDFVAPPPIFAEPVAV
jgi:phytanoyl-CoA hydroxylase